MARIVLGTATLGAGGGIALVARMTAQIIAEAGHEPIVVSYLDRPGAVEAPFPVQACGGSKLRYAAAVARHAIGAQLCLYDTASMARVHPRFPLPSPPSAVWMMGIEVWEGIKPASVRALRRANRVISVSQNTLRRFEALHEPLPQAVICPLATIEDAAPPPRTALREPMALIVGRIDAAENYKGHRELIEAWPAVVAAVPGARLAMAGGGSGLEDIRALAAQSPVARAIDVHGFLAPSELDALWAKASLFAMPSRGEGFGLVYAEAMRHGLAAVASVHDAGREVVADGITGFAVDLHRPGELAARLTALLADPALAQRMGEAGRARWEESFRFSRLKARLLPIIQSLLVGGA